ncbi:MAG: ferritin [Nitrospirae bacterium]|nr:ferritin [Nitrospirota bacterium]
MLSSELEKSLNEQMNREFYSAYLYLSMSSWFAVQELPGFANWFRVQTQEELVHAMKFFDFINGTGGHAIAAAIDGPPSGFESIVQVFEKSLVHEKFVTSCINKLVDQARGEGNHATDIFLQWFVTEQMEEESSVSAILKKARLIGDDGRGILMIDAELATRVFVPPAQQGG